MKCDRFDAKGRPAKGWVRKKLPPTKGVLCVCVRGLRGSTQHTQCAGMQNAGTNSVSTASEGS